MASRMQGGRTGFGRAFRTTLTFLLFVVLFIGLWEGYKALGESTGGMIPFTSLSLPVVPNDNSMPHVLDVGSALFSPAQRGSETLLIVILAEAALYTWREALVGFLAGSAIGIGLAVLFVMFAPLERGLMPYVIASQTVPLLAIAPMVVIWGGQIGVPTWLSVSTISAYLSFFPVTINTARGLRSPPYTAIELMRSYAASRRQMLWKLQLPAALPYIFTALKIAATASVIGALIGELPASLSIGLGRSLLTAAYFFGTSPENLFAAILIAGVLGLISVGLVAGVERLVVPAVRRVE